MTAPAEAVRAPGPSPEPFLDILVEHGEMTFASASEKVWVRVPEIRGNDSLHRVEEELVAVQALWRQRLTDCGCVDCEAALLGREVGA